MSFTYRALREAAHLCAKYNLESNSIHVFQGEIHIMIKVSAFEKLWFVKPFVEGNQRVYLKKFNRVVISAAELIKDGKPFCRECGEMGFTLNHEGDKVDCSSCNAEWVSLW